MAQKPSLDDYVDVAERIQAFKKEYADGSLQTVGWHVEEVAGKTFVVYRAAAYRNPDDKRPGHGSAWEPFPGPTPYTKDSELMNAETAAWGRAIVALGIVAKRIASRQEVQARTDDRPAAPKIPIDRAKSILKAANEVGLAEGMDLKPVLLAKLADVGVDTGKIGHLNVDQAEDVEAFIREEAPDA